MRKPPNAKSSRQHLVSAEKKIRELEKKPDPIELGRELGEFLAARWKTFSANVPKGIQEKLGILEKVNRGGTTFHVVVESYVYKTIEAEWERQFWQAKALGTKLP